MTSQRELPISADLFSPLRERRLRRPIASAPSSAGTLDGCPWPMRARIARLFLCAILNEGRYLCPAGLVIGRFSLCPRRLRFVSSELYIRNSAFPKSCPHRSVFPRPVFSFSAVLSAWSSLKSLFDFSPLLPSFFNAMSPPVYP